MLDFSRTLLECSLLSTASDCEISEVLEVSEEEIARKRQEYAPAGFGRLAKLEHILSVADKQERLFKLWSFNNGLEFVRWKLGLTSNIDPLQILQRLFMDSVMKSRESIYSSNTDETSKEAARWTALSIQMARILKAWTVDSNAATLELQMALVGTSLKDFKDLNDLC